MKQKTTFLPGISTKLQGRARRRQLQDLRERRAHFLRSSLGDYGVLFSSILPIDQLADSALNLRSRTFPQVVIFWAWFSQILDGNGSCAKAVAVVQSWYREKGLPIPSSDNSTFCRARKRLSEDLLDEIDRRTKRHAEARIESSHRWHGHRLKAIDGTTFQLQDTAANQEDYPQPNSQKPGCGFPIMGVAGVLDLLTGQLTDYHTGPYSENDACGLYSLMDTFQENDVVLADRAYCGYELIALLREREAHSVMRLHQKREGKLDWRRGKRLGKDSRLVTYQKPARPGKSGITQEQWERLPDEMTLRLVRARGTGRDGKSKMIYVATTLLDAEVYPSEEIAWLYAQRWKIEVRFRDIKTTMGLEEFRVRSPEMARKMMRMVQLSYNLIRALQLDALRGSDLVVDQLSFKQTLDVIIEFRVHFRGLGDRPQLLLKESDHLEERIAERTLRKRPGRSEPRVLKKRPKSFQMLTKPRSEFTEIPHRNHYRAAA